MWNEENPVPRECLLEVVQDVDGLLSVSADRIDETLLDRAKRLKVVSNAAVGFDNFDLTEMNKRKVIGTNTPGVLTETTADLTFGLLMATARRIAEGDRFVREGNWKGWTPSLMLGQDVYGSTLGIIGMGRIGEAVARRARGFDMEVLYHNRNRRPEAEEKLGCRYVSIQELLQQSDFVVLLAPSSPENRKMIGMEQFRLMKPSAMFINASRGSNVDEDALVTALQEKMIAAAGLDVFANEPIGRDHPLVKMDNVVVLPHIGSATLKTRQKMQELAVENLLAALQGKRPPNMVNPEVWS
jgi:lactate dehydrogenase-like 2-hydroxyacid dehydrogenase